MTVIKKHHGKYTVLIITNDFSIHSKQRKLGLDPHWSEASNMKLNINPIQSQQEEVAAFSSHSVRLKLMKVACISNNLPLLGERVHCSRYWQGMQNNSLLQPPPSTFVSPRFSSCLRYFHENLLTSHRANLPFPPFPICLFLCSNMILPFTYFSSPSPAHTHVHFNTRFTEQ